MTLGEGGHVLKRLLQERRDQILEAWFELVLEGYPADRSAFLKNHADPFHNPVGHTLRRSSALLFDALCRDIEAAEVDRALDDIVRMRAVQDGSAAAAASFVFLLKNAVRRELADRLNDRRWVDALLDFESRIDGLALCVFDRFMQCKEQIHEIKVRERQKRSAYPAVDAASVESWRDGEIARRSLAGDTIDGKGAAQP